MNVSNGATRPPSGSGPNSAGPQVPASHRRGLAQCTHDRVWRASGVVGCSIRYSSFNRLGHLLPHGRAESRAAPAVASAGVRIAPGPLSLVMRSLQRSQANVGKQSSRKSKPSKTLAPLSGTEEYPFGAVPTHVQTTFLRGGACRGVLSRPPKLLAPNALLVRLRRSDNRAPPAPAPRFLHCVACESCSPECAAVLPSGLGCCSVACTLALIAHLEFNMAWEHINLVRQVPLQYIAKLILFALASRVDDESKCWPSIDTLCHDTGLKHRTTQLHLKALVEGGRRHPVRAPRTPGPVAVKHAHVGHRCVGNIPARLAYGGAYAAIIRCRMCTRSGNRTTNKSPSTKVIHNGQPSSQQHCTDNVVGNPGRD